MGESSKRTCIICHYFSVDMGHPAYSDVTPSEGPTVQCRKGLWELGSGATEADFREHLLKAETCAKFLDYHDALKCDRCGAKTPAGRYQVSRHTGLCRSCAGKEAEARREDAREANARNLAFVRKHEDEHKGDSHAQG